MKDIIYWIFCTKCEKRVKSNLLISITDYEKEKTQHIYRCKECKRIHRETIDLRGK